MISASILQTLKYSDHFGFPLTLKEIHSRLVGASPCGRPLIQKTINQMLEQGQIEQSGDYYYLPGRSHLIARRLKHAKLSSPLIARAQELSLRLARTPFIVAIYLTGSLAMQNSDQKGDIDLMVITRDHRLWTTRLLLTLYTELLGLRRRPHTKQGSGKVCLNLYLTPGAYGLPQSKRSLYTAYELIQAVPLYDPHDTHSGLLAGNPWIKNYLPNFSFPKSPAKPLANFKTLRLYDYLEQFLYHLQLLYMRGKITREYVTRDSAFFHPKDPGRVVLEKINSRPTSG